MTKLKVSVGGRTHTLQSAQVILNDRFSGCGGERFNHCELWLFFSSPWTYGDGVEEWQCEIRFQRHGHRDEYFTPSKGWTDTRERWSTFYAGRFCLDLGTEITVGAYGGGLRVSERDRVKDKVAKRLAAIVSRFNLAHVEPHCDLKRTVLALEHVLTHVQRFYGDNQTPLSRARVDAAESGREFYANECAERKASAA